MSELLFCDPAQTEPRLLRKQNGAAAVCDHRGGEGREPDGGSPLQLLSLISLRWREKFVSETAREKLEEFPLRNVKTGCWLEPPLSWVIFMFFLVKLNQTAYCRVCFYDSLQLNQLHCKDLPLTESVLSINGALKSYLPVQEEYFSWSAMQINVFS